MEASSTRTTGRSAQRTADGATSQARQAVETAVDVPIGAALTVKDRVGELARPWRNVDAATSEVKSIRRRVQRELGKAERRGGSARRKATQRAKRTRSRLEREVARRRRRAEEVVRSNRRRAEQRFRGARTRVVA
jgi:hypothetical protein